MVSAAIQNFSDYIRLRLDAENYYSRDFSIIFLSLGTFAAAVPLIPFLQNLSCHGKRISLQAARHSDENSARTSKATIFSVRKSLFVHMYAVGVVWGAICFSRAVIIATENVMSSTANCYFSCVCLQGTLMFEIHCMRRLLECLYITAYGSSSMDVSAYLVGIFHYISAPSCILYSLLNHDHQHANERITALQILLRLLSLLLYAVGSASQFQCHRILFNMKRSGENISTLDFMKDKSNVVVRHPPLERIIKFNDSCDKSSGATVNDECASSNPLHVDHTIKSVYSFPVGFGFDYVACPHYTAEIIIYISFCMLAPSSIPLLCLLLWVLTNLSVVAESQYQWYNKNFQKEVSLKKGWNRLIPGVW